MLPEIIFSVLLAAIGIVIFIALPKLFTKPPKDYSNDPVIEGTVLHQEDFCGRRWLVSFYDEHGAEHLAMDDQLSSDTFHPERFAIPKTGTNERIRLRKRTNDDMHRGFYRLNSQPVEYTFHFCNEAFYDMKKMQDQRSIRNCRILGAAFVVLAILLLIF